VCCHAHFGSYHGSGWGNRLFKDDPQPARYLSRLLPEGQCPTLQPNRVSFSRTNTFAVSGVVSSGAEGKVSPPVRST